MTFSFFFPAQPVVKRSYILSDLLDKPWSQVSSLLPPPRYMLSFLSRIGCSILNFQVYKLANFYPGHSPYDAPYYTSTKYVLGEIFLAHDVDVCRDDIHPLLHHRGQLFR